MDMARRRELATKLRLEATAVTASGCMSGDDLKEAARMLEGGDHESDCATNDAPALEPGPCTCGEPRPEPKVEVHVGSVDKLKQVQMHQRFMTSWHMNILNELVQRHSGAWADGLTPNGDVNMRIPSVQEVIDRAVQTLDAMLEVAEKRGYVVPVPSLADLHEDAGQMGFTRRDT